MCIRDRFYAWTKSRRSSKRWAASLVRKLWQVAWDQWNHRNEIVHKSQEQEVASVEEKLDRAIRQEKRRGGGRKLTPRDRSLFATPLQRLLRMNIDDKQGWLDNIAAARRRRYAGPRGVPAKAAPAAVC